MREKHVEIQGLSPEGRAEFIALHQDDFNFERRLDKPAGMLAEMLEATDLRTLGQILKQEAHKSGIDVTHFSIIQSDRVLSTRHLGAAYISKWDSIRLPEDAYYEEQFHDSIALLTEEERQEFDWGRFIRLYLLRVLVHEQTHAAGRVRETVVDGAVEGFELGYRVGKISDEGVPETVFTGFNEGVTEKMSEDIFAEYAKQTGVPSNQDLTYFHKWYQRLTELGYGVYEPNVRLVNLVVQILSENSGQSSEVVWGAIKHGYFKGSVMDDPSTRELFEISFATEMLKRLFDASTARECQGLCEDLLALRRLAV